GEKDRVDQLGFAARKFRDKRNDQLVLVKALEQLLDGDIGLRVGELLLREPVVQFRYPRGQPAPPVAVCFKTRRQSSGLHARAASSRRHRGQCSIKRAKTRSCPTALRPYRWQTGQ